MKPIAIITGTVQDGNKRGKALGFPTVNLRTELKLAEGVYFSKTLHHNTWHNSLTFIGAAKTFDETDYLTETYILDFNKGLYGDSISVQILKKLRGNIKFPSVRELVEQMKKDEEEARKFFSQNKQI